MDYSILLDISAEIGYRLAMAGAETYRVEESISRTLAAYGIKGEVFVIPNCLHVSIMTDDGTSMTRMRRIGQHGNDLDTVEKYNSLSRKICAEKPDPSLIQAMLDETHASCIRYKLPLYLLAHALGAGGFTVFFGGTLLDTLWGAICGILIGLVNHFLGKKAVNSFFTTIASAFIMAFTAYSAAGLGITHNSDTVIMGAIMLLVPGLLFTNAMRDFIFGDTNSGTNRTVQVLLIAAAIGLGTGVAWTLARALFGIPVITEAIDYPLVIDLIAILFAVIGFSMIFNIHGKGILLCSLGSLVCWISYYVALQLGCGEILSYFIAGVICAVYSEALARIRKSPAIGYLVVAIFPIIPGAGIYYTTWHLLSQEMSLSLERGMNTFAIAGVIAVGILIVSTIVRFWGQHTLNKHHKKNS